MKKSVRKLLSLFSFFTFFPAVLFASEETRLTSGVPEDTEAAMNAKYRELGAFSPDLWQIPQGGQACAASRNVTDTNENQLVIDCEFFAKSQPEYLSIGTPLFVKKAGFSVGVRLRVEVLDEKDGTWKEERFPVNIRFVDPSGEYHQAACTVTCDSWLLAAADSTEPCWGGDNDKKLQFPCSIEYLVVDHPHPARPMKCRVTLFDVRLFRNQDVPKILSMKQMETGVKIGSGTESTGGNHDGDGNHDRNKTYINTTNVFPAGYVPENVRIQTEALAPFSENDVEMNVVRILNGQKCGEKKFEARKYPSGNVLSFPISSEKGYETLIFTPKTQGKDGNMCLGEPLRFSYAVTPKEIKRNPWFGICTHYSHGWRRETMDFLPAAGFGFLRDELGWGTCEPEKGKYVFPEIWDLYVNRAQELGVEPLVILDYANRNYDGGDFPHSDEGIAGFAGYCRAVAEHFRGRIKYYEIWNEWTGGCGMGAFRENGHNTPENYVRMIAAASKAIRETDPNAYIIGGGGDHHTYHFPQIEAMMKLGIMKYCDAFSVHPYIYQSSPEKAEARENLQKVIDCMRANGCENPKLWLTELGWPTQRAVRNQAEGVRSNESAVREDYEAQMFVRASVIYRSLPEVEAFFWYDLKNDGTDLSYNENNFGIIHNDAWNFQPKAAYSAAAVATQMLLGAESVVKNDALSNDFLSVYEIYFGNSRRILVAWALADAAASPEKEKPEAELALPSDMTVAYVVGLYGQTLPADTRRVGVQPVYFILK